MKEPGDLLHASEWVILRVLEKTADELPNKHANGKS